MDTGIAFEALAEKADCSPEDLEKHGLCRLWHGTDSYIGKAEKKPLGKRLLQHFNKAISNRKLTGNVDKELRNDPDVNNWKLKILPVQGNISAAEALAIAINNPTLNVQYPRPFV